MAISCSKEPTADAYGQFEVDETTISAETSGKLLFFNVNEGNHLEIGEKVALIDTLQLRLQKDELAASLQSVKTKYQVLNAQADVYREQLKTANKDFERIKALIKDKAATDMQLDEINGKINTLAKQIDAVDAQKNSVQAEVQTINAKIAQLDDTIRRGVVFNPVNGIVLNKYVEPFELVMPGQPLYSIANLDTLILRAFVSGAQLPRVVLGNPVEVLVDKDSESDTTFTGMVNWIASEAEFTPKMIQTKEERVTQVYAIKISVPNANGYIKIGMPGEVNFPKN